MEPIPLILPAAPTFADALEKLPFTATLPALALMVPVYPIEFPVRLRVPTPLDVIAALPVTTPEIVLLVLLNVVVVAPLTLTGLDILTCPLAIIVP